MHSVFELLSAVEVTSMQALCKFMYSVGVSRVQTSVKSQKEIYLTVPDHPCLSKRLIIVRADGEVRFKKKDFSDKKTVQVGPDLFTFTDRAL